MGRPRSAGTQTRLGQFLAQENIPYEEAAREFGVTPSYVGSLSRGDATPKLKLGFQIEDWARRRAGTSRNPVPIASWRPWCGLQ